MKLILFKVNQLGDNLVFLPSLQTLLRRYPEWEVRVVTSPSAAGLYTGLLPADSVWPVPTAEFNGLWKRPLAFLSWLRRVRAFGPGATWLSDDQGNAAHALSALSGASVRVGPRPGFVRVRGGVNVPSPAPAEGLGRQARWAWDGLRRLLERLAPGDCALSAEPPVPDLSHLVAPARAETRGVLIHPGASKPYKRWPQDRFAELANHLADEQPVTWVAHDLEPPAQLRAEVEVVRPASLRELLGHLSGCRLFVGNHSGPFHLANALGRTSLILSGLTRVDWDPLWHRERVRILRDESLADLPRDTLSAYADRYSNTDQPMACLEAWSVDEVRRQAQEMLLTLNSVAPS
ncbi:MAG: glycosyltransferase family 9 protein [Verrucomicrobiota bacterium]